MAIEYRAAAERDIPEVSRVEADAVDRVNRKHGFFQGPTDPLFDVPYFTFMLKKIPNAFWVAEDQGKVVGVSTSWVRGPLWFLSDLFVSPDHQGRHVGRNLIKRTMGSWDGTGISNRALITFAYNPTSISLYMRFKMYPVEPLYLARASPELVRKNLARSGRLAHEEPPALSDVAPHLQRIDEKVLGFSLGWHHEYFFEAQRARCLVFKKDDAVEGYAYVRRDGRIGPIAVTPAIPLEEVMTTAVAAAAEQDTAEDVVAFFPGSNEQAVETALRCGLRITYPMLFMSRTPIGDWANYVFYSPGLM